LIEHLPPVGSDDTATNSDVDARVDRILAEMREDLRRQTRTFIVAAWLAHVTVGALAFAAARLA
jgi:hypothetical protein